ncbi:GDSL esterase/lipase At5g14450 isoform X2 [Physcomitrium patens]|uniref:GDSL esterase/lipase At5g14450 isoform X2 n=1 Tax=Physcomitrium patens TaxID=3218 RepID=UPI000D16E39C|nr:GDSL esterase/lipase At5g14450-like isoform X2 [Physcomitrium patens]|eukprot:XP_024360448.1 GDSL esterase/lipase At5g14450-like isoform X2 [Physcomitrella patens]
MASIRRQRSALTWTVLTALYVVSWISLVEISSKALPNCSYPAVYSFGDSLSDVGNSITTFPDKFALSELDPFEVEYPMHADDRLSDGKLLVDFIEFGVGGSPNFPWLRSIAVDFEFGTNFASAGGSARNSTGWKPLESFTTPFSLNVQVQWFERYTVRLSTYYYFKNTFGDVAGMFSIHSRIFTMCITKFGSTEVFCR